MKILEKIKKKIIGIGTFLITIPVKVFAVELMDIQPEYGVQQPVPKLEPASTIGNNIWNVCKTLVIPLILLIGIIIYFKRSKSTVKKKIFITILIISIVLIAYFVNII